MRTDFGRRTAAEPARPAPDVSVRAAAIAAGMAGFLLAYWVWRGILVIPFELPEAIGGITFENSAPSVRPWAPWWVVPSISAAATTLVWRVLAVRGGRISILRSMGALALGCIAIFPIASFALELGAIAQYVPAPSVFRVLMVLPAIAADSIGFTVIHLAWHGIVLLPAAALLGLVVAGGGRLVRGF